MLGDDIMEGTKSVVGTVGHAIRSAFKGALMFGAIVGVAALGVALVAGALEGGLLGLFTAEFGSALLGQAGNIAGLAGTGAIIGGAVTGVASLIPGSEEGFTLRKLFTKRERANDREPPQRDLYPSAPSQESIAPGNPYMQPHHNTMQPHNTIVVNSQQQPENPNFVPGKGAELMQRGNEREDGLVR
jgi:hypothetical protein